ncbi:hypothetical protein ACJMK2_021323 [Sinanodonta woodiana]|uniref:Uncharacterized protein n=1 Tax=Sinanodonta woodiana TaxID=1069815 RepID=A0ABD3TFS0_SINWO
MMKKALVIMVLVAIHCIQSQGQNNTTEPDIEAQGQINTTEHSRIKAMVRSQENKSINDCDLPPLHTPQRYTAGRTLCRANTSCDNYQGTSYSWCYTDFSNRWDYCCDGECNYHDKTYLWCSAGDTWQYCGNCLTRDLQGRPCLDTFPCGVHNNELKQVMSYYWCYVDLNGNWDYCCAPHRKCRKGSKSYNWCYIMADTTSEVRRDCVPEE